MVGDVLLGVVSACTMVSYLPQMIRLLKTKKSSDISINSWILWVVSSFTYTLYAFVCSNEKMLIFETSLESLFCILILFLSVLYKNNK